MRLIDAEPIERKLFRQADKALAKNPYENARVCAFRRVLGLILDAPTITFPPNNAPPNDPLTLEELREMDGAPVWDPNLGEWGIVDIHGLNGEGCIRYVNNWWHPRCLMSRRFYRRKPEEEHKGR